MKKQEKELFARWKKEGKRNKFIPDGIIDEQSYLNSQLKVLYILKEVNGGENWDLAKFLEEGGRAKTWNNVTRWQHGITNIEKEIRWGDIAAISKETRRNQLKNIAVINLKKEPGKAKAIAKHILTYAIEDIKYLKEQIQIYSPDIIICCGTGEIVKELELIEKFDKWDNSKHGEPLIKFYRTKNQTKSQLIINYYHPAYYGKSTKELFYPLYKTIKDIYTK